MSDSSAAPQDAGRLAGLERLTPLEISTLRHVHDHLTAKEIARIEGVSEDAIVNRINRARAKLGGVSRVQAAKLVAQAAPLPAAPAPLPAAPAQPTPAVSAAPAEPVVATGPAPASVAGGATSHQMGYQPMGDDAAALLPHQGTTPMPTADRAGASGFGWPFPTKSRPVNDDRLIARIAWPIGLAFLTILALVMLNTVLQSLGNLRL